MKIFSLFLLTSSTIALSGCQTVSSSPTDSVVSTSPAPVETPVIAVENTPPADPKETNTRTRQFTTSELDAIAAPFDFTATIPASWRVEYVPEIEAINFYDPTVEAPNTLEQSQIFIRYFTATNFLTLSTVTIYSQIDTTINNRPAVVYDIEKKPDIANFSAQPNWRNARHFVTDIRSSDSSPTTFYVFAKRPELAKEVFEQFIQSVQFQ